MNEKHTVEKMVEWLDKFLVEIMHITPLSVIDFSMLQSIRAELLKPKLRVSREQVEDWFFTGRPGRISLGSFSDFLTELGIEVSDVRRRTSDEEGGES